MHTATFKIMKFTTNKKDKDMLKNTVAVVFDI